MIGFVTSTLYASYEQVYYYNYHLFTVFILLWRLLGIGFHPFKKCTLFNIRLIFIF